jgi:hypothetical protein
MTTDPLQNNDWQSAGWESEEEMIKWMISTTFDERLRWICETNERIVELHGQFGLAWAKGLTIIPNKKDVWG